MSGAALPTIAQPGGMRVFYEFGAGTPPPDSKRTVTGNATTGEVKIEDALSFSPLPPGVVSAAALTATRIVGASGIAAAAAARVASCFGNPICVGTAAIAGAGAALLDSKRIRNKAATDLPPGTGGLARDAGQVPVQMNVYTWNWGNGPGYAASQASACVGASNELSAIKQAQAPAGHTVSVEVIVCAGNATFKVWRRYTGPFCNSGQPGTCTIDDGNFGTSIGQTTAPKCQAYIDPLDPSVSKPAGADPGSDGKCPTGRYSEISLQQAADMIAADPALIKAHMAQVQQMMLDWLHSGLPCEGCSAVAPSITGPTQLEGQPVTSTKTDASGTTTTTTKTDYPMEYPAPINLGGELGPYKVVRYGQQTTTSTTTTPAGGGASTTTTTTTGTNADGTAVQAKEKEAVTQCDKFPDSVGCAKLGDVPSDQVPKKTPTVAFASESVSLPAGCPSPKFIQGRQYSYAELCTAATNARPFVIIGAMFSSLMLVLAAFRQL